MATYSTGPGTQYWPRMPVPWLPTPWQSVTRTILPEQACLGTECWNLRRLTFFNACQIQDTLLRRSWPIQTTALMAIALYEHGYWSQARAVCRAYDGHYGPENFHSQMRRVYNGLAGPG